MSQTPLEVIRGELDKLRRESSWAAAVSLWDLAIQVAEQARDDCAYQDVLDRLPDGMPPQTKADHLAGRLAAMASHRAILALREAKTFAEHRQQYEDAPAQPLKSRGELAYGIYRRTLRYAPLPWEKLPDELRVAWEKASVSDGAPHPETQVSDRLPPR